MQKEPKILIICGATASGKSEKALEIARARGGVIINADSQQVYSELRILTARPSEAEEALAPHRLYGFLPAHEPCSAALWLKHAQMEIDWALQHGQLPIVTGGTGLYLRALMEGIADIPEVPPGIRALAEADLAAMGGEAFHARLAEADPATGSRLRPSDPQRLVRAWAVWLGTGKPLSWWHNHTQKPLYDRCMFEIIHVEHERSTLYTRIDRRVLSMLECGAVAEVEQLLALNLPSGLPSMRIIGVPEIGAHLRGETDLYEAAARIQQMSRNYAKRQITWFRHQLPSH